MAQELRKVFQRAAPARNRAPAPSPRGGRRKEPPVAAARLPFNAVHGKQHVREVPAPKLVAVARCDRATPQRRLSAASSEQVRRLARKLAPRASPQLPALGPPVVTAAEPSHAANIAALAAATATSRCIHILAHRCTQL